MLDNPDINDSTLPSFFSTDTNPTGDLGMHTHILRRSCGRRPEVFGLAPQLHQSPHGDQPSELSEHYIPHAPSTSPSLHETQLLEAAMKLQMKAAKSDLVFRMVDSFNRNTVQATVTWMLLNHGRGTKVIVVIIRFPCLAERSSRTLRGEPFLSDHFVFDRDERDGVR